MSKLEIVLLTLAVGFTLVFPQSGRAEISSLDQSQFTQPQFNRRSSQLHSGSAFYGDNKSTYFPVYLDSTSHLNHYFATGLAGDQSDVVFNLASRQQPHSGKTCVRVNYKNRCSQGRRWVGMYWQNPAYNWGYKNGGGYNLTGVTKLIFWARGEKGGEVIDNFAAGGTEGSYRDSAKGVIGPIVLTSEWKQYEIDLSNKDLSSISGGFSWTASYYKNRQGSTFYLDDICYV